MQRRTFISALGAVALARSHPATAQQTGTTARIGLLTINSIDAERRAGFDAIRQSLNDLGYIEGRNIIFEHRSADSRIERLPELARELVALKVDLIIAGATPGGLAARQATDTIPIVASAMGDPVSDGLVSSLARPGGNVTGTTFLGPELIGKRLGLLRELLPSLSRVGVLRHPGAFGEHTMSEMLKEAAGASSALGIQLQFADVRSPDQIAQAMDAIVGGHAEALFQFPSAMLFNERRQLVELAGAHRLPAMFNAREFIVAGGLIAYGANLVELSRRAAFYVDKILKGAKPADLPIEQPTKFELAINLKTARELGLTVPHPLLLRADEVIE
jgi:putative ABC transport system substrate-binding protein